MILALDLLLAAGLVLLAIQTVHAGGLFRSIVMFIVFGLVMALAWSRLNAPDLAMAEAAIGAGITGALLLITARRLKLDPGPVAARPPPLLGAFAVPVALLAALLVGAVGWAALGIPPGDVTAGLMAREALAHTGVSNPVTGVLLAFRGYDTLLEVAVLLLAFLGARAVLDPDRTAPPPAAPADLPLVGALLSIVVPMTVLVGIYLLRAGGHAPGGAFQAGAVLAAGGVLLLLTGRVRPARHSPLWMRLVLVSGVVVFSAMGLGVMALGGAMLQMPGAWAIYLVETAMMLSIALPLILLFAGSAGLRKAGP